MASNDSNKMIVWNNSKTMNIPDIMHKSILHSQYFKDLYEITDYNEAVQEIVSSVNNLLPTKGLSSNQPSESICLLYKLFTLKLTRRQIEAMFEHRNVFVKALGLLYVRFTVLPKEQWEFYQNFVCSELKIEYMPKQVITLGEFVIGIVQEQRFLKTVLFPRIPGHILTEINSQIDAALSKVHKGDRYDRRRSSPDRRKRQRSRSPDRSYKRERSDYEHGRSRARERTPSPPRSPPESRFGFKPVVDKSQVYSDLPQVENPYATESSVLLGETSRRLNYATTAKKKSHDWRKILAEEEVDE